MPGLFIRQLAGYDDQIVGSLQLKQKGCLKKKRYNVCWPYISCYKEATKTVLILLERRYPSVYFDYKTIFVQWMVAKIFVIQYGISNSETYWRYDAGRSVFVIGRDDLSLKAVYGIIEETLCSLTLFYKPF